jgi:hypothetical protein
MHGAAAAAAGPDGGAGASRGDRPPLPAALMQALPGCAAPGLTVSPCVVAFAYGGSVVVMSGMFASHGTMFFSHYKSAPS